MSSFIHRYLILDTSILLIWLRVPGYESCGKGDNIWDIDRINNTIDEELQKGSYLVLPLASIIESGNVITKINNVTQRECYADKLVAAISATANSETPWMAFSNQEEFWSSNELCILAKRWQDEVKKKGNVMSLADLSIIKIAEFYSLQGTVQIISGDGILQSYQPKLTAYVPRRRQ